MRALLLFLALAPSVALSAGRPWAHSNDELLEGGIPAIQSVRLREAFLVEAGTDRTPEYTHGDRAIYDRLGVSCWLVAHRPSKVPRELGPRDLPVLDIEVREGPSFLTTRVIIIVSDPDIRRIECTGFMKNETSNDWRVRDLRRAFGWARVLAERGFPTVTPSL